MGFKSLLVHVDAGPRSVMRLRVAAELAKSHGASLTAFYVAPSMVGEVPFEVDVPAGLAYKLLSELNVRRERDAAAWVERVSAETGTGIDWAADGIDDPASVLGRRALVSDLVVLGQHDRDGAVGEVRPELIGAVAIASGSPVLAIPYVGCPAAIGRRVLVAWKATASSSRAVRAALPFLRDAEVVYVVSWGEESSRAAIDFLRRHGVAAELRAYPDLPQDLGGLLLSTAADVSADLLVMGCYGHSRARELVLGGVTRSVLGSMTLPVLMAH